MKYTKTTTNALLLFTLLFSQQLFAGTIYRFEDQNGVITMSKSLPPYAAQKGYDVLNDKSLRLIKRVDPALTPEQIAEKEKQLAIQQEQERLAAQEVEQKREQRRQQQIADQTLLASYQSEQDLISARDTDLSYRQTQLEKAKQHLESSKVKLQQAQQDAAEQELSGKTISVNMNKRLTAAQQEIDNAQQNIARLEQEIEQLNKQYESDLERLKLLLSQKQN